MKRCLRFQLFVLLSFVLFVSADNPERTAKKAFKKAGYIYVPSGATLVNGNLTTVQGFYISEGEISNAQYRDFLDSLTASGDSAALAEAKVYPEKWNIPYSSMENFEKHYFTHPAYDHYPVVNITQQGARLYCEWLEKQFAAKGIRVQVRLPERAEWVMAARGGHSGNIYPWTGEALRDKRGLYLANYKTEKTSDDGSYITAITKSYKPNDYGLFNMAGNVSEWIADKGICIGGNWWSEPEYLKIDAPPEFPLASDPSPFIGFRPVFTVVE